MTTETTVSAAERQQLRAETRRILLFLRAANRLRELTTNHAFRIKLNMEPALVQPADPRQRVMSSVDTLEATDRLIVENAATRIRPFMMKKEDCFFPDIVSILPKHVRVDGGPHTFDELAAKWHNILNATGAPLPVGTEIHGIIPGYVAEATSEGQLKLMVEHELLTGREVIELLLYGELVHIDRKKERKLLRIREVMPAGFQASVIAVTAALAYVIDVLRLYAQGFAAQLPADTIADIEENL
jgi:hypothetical protein